MGSEKQGEAGLGMTGLVRPTRNLAGTCLERLAPRLPSLFSGSYTPAYIGARSARQGVGVGRGNPGL